MRYPEFIKKGETVGFAAPSFGAYIEPYHTLFLSAEEKITKKGFRIQEGPNVFRGDGIGISSTPENCGHELTEMYVSTENQSLISVGGGELMCEALNHVDFEKIAAARPKWFMGYSDNTNFNFLLPTLCDTAAIYGPCASSFGMEPWHKSIKDTWDFFTGRTLHVHGYGKWEKEKVRDEHNPLAPYHVTAPTKLKFYSWDLQPVSGRFIGGCVDCLVNLLGTKFDRVREFNARYKEDGFIWFLECCDLNVMAIRRAIWQMNNAGWFEHVKAFIIGRPLVMGQEMMGLDQYEAVLYGLRQYKVPVIMDADIGHLPPTMPLISGGFGTVRPVKNNIEIDFELR